MTEKRFNDFRRYKRFDTYFDDYMQLWTISDNENDNMLYPCTSENMANEFAKLLNELHDENEQLKQRINSRLHFYRELYDSTHDDIVKRVVEDLEDILKGDVE